MQACSHFFYFLILTSDFYPTIMAPKKIVQDILPSKRRTIRDVPTADEQAKKTQSKPAATHSERGIRVPIHRERTAEEKHPSPAASSPSVKDKERKNSDKEPPKESHRGKKVKGGRTWKWIVGGIVIVSCIVIVYEASVHFARASVEISLRSEEVNVDGDFSAAQNAVSPNLAYEIISTTTSAHISVAATPGPIVNAYATGWALLISASTTSSQKIIAGTHLEDARGLIYKTVSTVVIPAATSKSFGTAYVKIIADAPGAAYNSSLTDLKGDLSIVAWKGTPKAKLFYGRVTSDVKGGASGPKMSVSKADLGSAVASLSSSLSASSGRVLQSMVPGGYILYSKATGIALSSTTVSSLGSTTADVSIKAYLTGIAFKRSDLENALAKDEIAQFPADNYIVNGLDSLAFAPVTGQTISGATKSLKFMLSGDLTIVGVIDAAAIKSQLEGKPLSESNSVFSEYSSVISGAQASVAPFWIRTIPRSSSRISIVVSTSTGSI